MHLQRNYLPLCSSDFYGSIWKTAIQYQYCVTYDILVLGATFLDTKYVPDTTTMTFYDLYRHVIHPGPL